MNQLARQPIHSLHVSELARESGVTPATVRYYARIGLLSSDREPGNGYRRFSLSDRHRLTFIRQAQALGLTIGDIRTLLDTIDHGKPPCSQVRALVTKRLARIERQIEELGQVAGHMRHALAAWDRSRDPSPSDGEYCPLIERLDAGAPGVSRR